MKLPNIAQASLRGDSNIPYTFKNENLVLKVILIRENTFPSS